MLAPLVHRARKRFGQHFLQDDWVIEQMLQALNPQSQDALVEIGPGLGALTEPLIQRAKRLTVIELDRSLANHWQQRASRESVLTVIQQDALRVDFADLAEQQGVRLRVLGNLPYNISTPLLLKLLEQSVAIQDMLLMLQAEVAQRLTASPGSKAYGRLTVLTHYYCDVELLFLVPAEAFRPAPKVTSAVVRLIPHQQPPYPVADLGCLQKICAAAFSQRRKTLRNSLQALFTGEQLKALAIDPTERAESITLEQYCRLANSLKKF